MKSTAVVSVLGTALLVALFTVWAQSRQLSPSSDMMRHKLDHAQSVLEGITMENFDLIANHARKLRALSDEASWRTFDNPEYLQQSELFRRNVDGLIKAATNHNLDGATLAYTKMTFSCVECHKYIRGRKVGLSTADSKTWLNVPAAGL